MSLFVFRPLNEKQKKENNSASSVYPVGPEERGASAVKYLTRNPSGLMIVD